MQPGKVHPPSRTCNARICARANNRSSWGYVDIDLEHNKIGIVNYTGQGFVQAPLTDGYEALSWMMDKRMGINQAPGGGSDYAEGLKTALEMFKTQPQDSLQKVILLFTDGGFTGDPEELTKVLAAIREQGIRMGLGTDTAPPDLVAGMQIGLALCRVMEGDPEACRAEHYLDVATLGGADALGRPDLGRIAVGAAAGLHLDLACDNFGVQELARVPGQVLPELFPIQAPFENGHLLPPTRPGLGVLFDETAVAKYPPIPKGACPQFRRSDESFTNW